MFDLNYEGTRTFPHCIQSQNDFFVSVMFIPRMRVEAVVLTPMTLKTVVCLRINYTEDKPVITLRYF